MKKFMLMTVAAFGLCLAACSGGSAPLVMLPRMLRLLVRKLFLS